MSEEKRRWHHGGGAPAASGGVLWFIGFLFTWGFTNPVWWKIMLGLIIWPYYLAQALR